MGDRLLDFVDGPANAVKFLNSDHIIFNLSFPCVESKGTTDKSRRQKSTHHGSHANTALPDICDFSGCRKNPKNSDTRNICCIHPKIWTRRLFYRVLCPKYADGMANSVDLDQTAPNCKQCKPWSECSLKAVWFGSTLFAQTCLSETLAALQVFISYLSFIKNIACILTKMPNFGEKKDYPYVCNIEQ